jgi:hypothetical protein
MPPKPSKTPKSKKGASGKRHPLNMRTTEDVRRKLEAAAEHSGRSLAQEVEARLEQSFNIRALIDEALGPPQYRDVALAVVGSFGFAGEQYASLNSLPSGKWMHDQHALGEAISSGIKALLSFLPDDDAGRVAIAQSEEGPAADRHDE